MPTKPQFFDLLDILPYKVDSEKTTREFLQKIVDVLLDHVKATNDRNEKILEFHHPEDMIKLLDLRVPDQGVSLQQLIHDCATTLKYQVKTGELIYYTLSMNCKSYVRMATKPGLDEAIVHEMVVSVLVTSPTIFFWC
ncbi:hypothetical protein JTB14_008315 [Gonioctena quinquepunctata]|nr:hypothetical protein JTB14_008315 [Gonioctena quinquepunctata]